MMRLDVDRGRVQVLIADDHEIIRRGVRSILESRNDIRICGEAANGREAVNKASELHPDLIILDQAMPVLSGLAAASQIRQIMPQVPILMLSMHAGKPLLDALRLLGVRGFVPKAECAGKLLEAVDAVLRGETFFNIELSSCMGLSE
jgi:DNA-binding NarL/FixJ family response regulator